MMGRLLGSTLKFVGRVGFHSSLFSPSTQRETSSRT